MSITLPNLTTLDPNQVAQAHSQLAARLAEFAPSADLRRGFIGDAVLHLAAVVMTAIRDLQAQQAASATIAGLAANPTLADPATVAALFSNYKLSPSAGSPATGILTILVSADTSFSLDASFSAAVAGLLFTIDQPRIVQIDENHLTSSTDLALQFVRAGVYLVNIPMVASASGSTYNVPQGTPAVLTTPPNNFLSAYAGTNFTGGAFDQDNADISAEIVAGLAAAGSSSDQAILGALSKAGLSLTASDISICAAGNAEQRRYHSVFPIAFGGRVDAWLRTAPLWQETVETVTATLVNIVGGHGIWQFAVPASMAPGFYDILFVIITSNGLSVSISSDVRSYDLTGASPPPDITTAVEAAYTAYQTSVIQLTDTRTSTAGLTIGVSTQQYTITIRGLPDIAVAQAALSDPGYGCPGLNPVIRAAAPCYVIISAVITVPAGDPGPNIAAIQNALSVLAGNTSFVNKLTAASVLAVIQKYLTAGQSVGSLVLTGHLRRPDGAALTINGNPDVVITTDTANMISAKTVCFFIDPADVTLTIS